MSKKGMLWMVCGLVLLAGLAFFGNYVRRLYYPAHEEESAEEIRQSVKEVFAGGNATDGRTLIEKGDPRHDEILDFFDRFRVAADERDGSAVREMFYVDGILNSLEQQGLIPERMRKMERRELLDILSMALTQVFDQFSGYFRFDTFSVPRIERRSSNTVVAYTKMWDGDAEIYTRMRWWLVKTPGAEWRAFDYEDVMEGGRLTQQMGVGFEPGMAKAPWMPILVRLTTQMADMETVAGLAEGGAEMRADVEDFLEMKPPPLFEMLALGLSMTYLTESEDAVQLHKNADRLLALQPDSPMAEYMRIIAYQLEEQWDEALAALDGYVVLFDWDAETHALGADLCYGAGRMEKAVEHAKAGLLDQSDSWYCMELLGLSLKAEDKHLIEPHVRKLIGPLDSVDYFLDSMLFENDFPAARAFLAVYKGLGLEEEEVSDWEEFIREAEEESAEETENP